MVGRRMHLRVARLHRPHWLSRLDSMQRFLRALGMGVVFLAAVSCTATAQGTLGSGNMTFATTKDKLWGATVRGKGTMTHTVPDQQGPVCLVEPSDAVLR